jgi:hypothetical protein
MQSIEQTGVDWLRDSEFAGFHIFFLPIGRHNGPWPRAGLCQIFQRAFMILVGILETRR